MNLFLFIKRIKMEDLSKDIYFALAKDMDIRDLLNFCMANKKANQKICHNEDVWRYRLSKEFENWQDFKLEKSLIETYVFLYQIKILKNKLELKENIYELYNLEKLNLSHQGLKTIPKEIGKLSNLQRLNLSYNKLAEIPTTIEQLSNLRILYLHNNQLKEIPTDNRTTF